MLKALKEYLPDPDERRSLVGYMKKGEKSEDERKALFADLSETEKYMVTMMEVEEAAQKLDAMMFRSVFKSRCEDITAATKTLNLACDELRSSEKLRKLMAVILTVVNQINTGGEGKAAMGFTLDALLKLNEVGNDVRIDGRFFTFFFQSHFLSTVELIYASLPFHLLTLNRILYFLRLKLLIERLAFYTML